LLSFAAAGKSRNLSNYTFDDFVKEYNLSYDSSEIDYRRSIFLAELARVRSHNFKNLSWKEGINKFSAMTVAEKSGTTGRSKGVAAVQSKAFKALKSAGKMDTSEEQAPEEMDWRNQGNVISH
jgi:hypothetical protein